MSPPVDPTALTPADLRLTAEPQPLTRAQIDAAMLSPRFELLGSLGVDREVIKTWNPTLSRRRRILIPVDVQALVSGDTVPAEVVPLTGRQGDPPPFTDATPLPAGVHLHWAMPDALLGLSHDEATDGPAMRSLPDTWVVVRTLQPLGRRTVHTTGWVIDATTATVVPLSDFTGSFPASTGSSAGRPLPTFAPLTGASDGIVWTSSYAASSGRFGFHDTLEDLEGLSGLAPDGFAADQACYTVAGWWRQQAEDPLAAARGPAQLDEVLAGLGWSVDHEGDESALEAVDPRIARLKDGLGLDAPSETPATQVLGADGRRISGALDATSFAVAYPVSKISAVVIGDGLPRYDSLLHGSVLGVPLSLADSGEAPDDAPAPTALGLAVGSDLDDVVAAFGSSALHEGDLARRSAVEDVVAAFSAGLVNRLGATDGLDDLGRHEHSGGFWALPGVDLPGARPDRLRVEDTLGAGPMTVGRAGRGAQGAATGIRRTTSTAAASPAASRQVTALDTEQLLNTSKLQWKQTFDLADAKLLSSQAGTGGSGSTGAGKATSGSPRRGAQNIVPPKPGARPTPATPQAREVLRPAPRYYRPAPFLVAISGARPSHRHHRDGLYDDQGRLACRYPGAAVLGLDSIVDGATVLPSLGSGAIPDEVAVVVRETVLLNPYAQQWLVDAAAPRAALRAPMITRVAAESARLYGTDGTYDGTSHISFTQPKAARTAGAQAWADQGVIASAQRAQVASELARFSILRGTPPSPIAHTTWRQPWVPLWVEWQVTLTGNTTVRGWELDGFDLTSPAPAAGEFRTTLTGRGLLGQGVAKALTASLAGWVGSELQRQATAGNAAFGDASVLQSLGDLQAPLDLVSASLDGLREQLLGIDFSGVVERETGAKPVASGTPTTLFGGQLVFDGLRLVDAFGRVVELPAAALRNVETTVELQGSTPGAITLRPRFQGSARWLWRLVDASPPVGTTAAALAEAYVDQLDPASAVNPVAGFLLPDHIDETLEFFASTGEALGEVLHDPVSEAVVWEPAPGRPLPPDAGPLVDVPDQSRLVAHVAAGLVRADAAARASASPPAAGALVTLLRAIDSTVWTIDTYASLGTGTVAGLIGRPIAVVRTTLTLDVPDDVDEVDVIAPGGASARRAAFAALADEQIEVQLGTLARADDALLGYFVNDDYEHLHVVDKVLAGHARETGRHLGQLGMLGQPSQQGAPDETTLDHPYLITDGHVLVRPGAPVHLTLLMLPAGRAHLTSGVLPRKDLALADGWYTPGLTKVMPSVRVGPVLVDPAEIRLPLVSLLGDKQTFTRRTAELAWRDDPILAATQTAYLPRLPHEAQEGWIRVSPAEEESGS